MTYNLWTDSKPDLVASTERKGTAFKLGSEHTEAGAVLITEQETGTRELRFGGAENGSRS
jgi:hypothetical protein